MKVLHILNSLMPSGAETMLVSSVNYWKDCELSVLSTQKELGIYANTMERAGFSVHHIWSPSLWDKHRKILSFIKKEHFDVVHIHPQSQSLFYALDAKLAGVSSVVRTVHSTFLFTGLLRFRETIFRMMMRFMGVRFVSISDSVAENERIRFHNKTTTIYNWCSPRFDFISQEEKREIRHKKYISDEQFILLSVGNCCQVKNHQMIFESLHLLEHKESLKYIHVGDNDAEEKKLAEQLGLSQYVTFMGVAKPDEYLSIADCYVMSSLREGLSISTIEAITCGLPVILTDVPGLRDFQKYHFKQVYFSPLSAKALGNQIAKIMAERPANSYEQSQQAKKLYSAEKGVDMYLKLYQSAKGKKKQYE